MNIDNFSVTSDISLQSDSVLMRYLDLAMFIDLISTETLFVSPATWFDDQLEGTLPEQIRESYLNDPLVIEHLGSDPIEEREEQNRIKTIISCWTKGPKDNMALWKIYGGSTQSLAITTSFDKLVQSTLLWKDDLSGVNFKDVVYIDHEGDLPDGAYSLSYETFGLKNEAYSFENEVRMIVTRNHLKNPSPLRLKIKPNYLIESIIIAPEAGDWFIELVKSVTEKYGISAPVTHSRLTALIEKAKYKN